MTFTSLRRELSVSGGFKLAVRLSLWLFALPLSSGLSERSEEKASNRELRRSHLIVLAYQEAVRTMAQDWAEAGPDRGGFREEDMVSFRADVSYGDMRRDGSEVAAVEVHYHLGEAGTANFSGVFLYALQGGGARLLDRVKGGDRAHGGIKSAFISFDDGQLIVARYRPTKADCNACYGFIETTQYELRGTKLVAKNVRVEPITEKNK
jgi:hypothetical protein